MCLLLTNSPYYNVVVPGQKRPRPSALLAGMLFAMSSAKAGYSSQTYMRQGEPANRLALSRTLI